MSRNFTSAKVTAELIRSPDFVRLSGMAKANATVRLYYVLPCCLLLLNLVNAVIGYQAGRIGNPWLRTAAVMGLVLFGGSLVAFFIAPGVEALVRWLQRTSRAKAGGLGEACFLVAMGAGVFWLYYLLCNEGVGAILPSGWRHP